MGKHDTFLFLLDQNCNHLKPSFPKGRAKTLADVGVSEQSTDTEILAFASEREFLIVTENDRDFLRAMKHACSRSGGKGKICGDAWGMLVVPSGLGSFDYRGLSKRLRYKGHPVGWQEIAQFNLRVAATARDGNVTGLPRCPECDRENPRPR
jgi:hypothetical protein